MHSVVKSPVPIPDAPMSGSRAGEAHPAFSSRRPPLVQDARLECDLPDALREELAPIVLHADDLALAGHPRSAIGGYMRALEMIPSGRCPRARAAVLLAIGDAAVRGGQPRLAVHCLQDAIRVCGELCNPLLYLRLGQAQLELGDLLQAGDQLYRAHTLGRGDAEFEGEDPKYLAFLQAQDCLR